MRTLIVEKYNISKSRYEVLNDWHFTEKLADFASEHLINHDGHEHRWTCEDVAKEIEKQNWHKPEHIGDVTYLANKYYSDLCPEIIKEPTECIRAALLYEKDPDGYEGKIFKEWVMLMKARKKKIQWELFI